MKTQSLYGIVIRCSCCLSFVLGLSVSVYAEEALVVNSSVTASSLTEEAFKDIYLGKTSIWADGTKITVVVMKSGPSNEALMKRLNKSPNQFLSSWKKLVFTGKGAMPEMVANDQAMIEFITKTPGAIGYVAKDKVSEANKILQVQ